MNKRPQLKNTLNTFSKKSLISKCEIKNAVPKRHSPKPHRISIYSHTKPISPKTDVNKNSIIPFKPLPNIDSAEIPTVAVELVPEEIKIENNRKLPFDSIVSGEFKSTVNTQESIQIETQNKQNTPEKNISPNKTKLAQILTCVSVRKNNEISKLHDEICLLNKMLNETRSELNTLKENSVKMNENNQILTDKNEELAQKLFESNKLCEIKDRAIVDLRNEISLISMKYQNLLTNQQKSNDKKSMILNDSKIDYSKFLSTKGSPKKPILKHIISPEQSSIFYDPHSVNSPKSVATPLNKLSNTTMCKENEDLRNYKEFIKQLLALKGISQCIFKSLLEVFFFNINDKRKM